MPAPQPPSLSGEATSRAMTVLAVEDDPRTASVLREGLEGAGWAAELLHRGDEAVQRISTRSYDAVVMDIMLPGCDGLTAVKQLRAMNNATPVLLLSARGDVDQRISGLNAGADDYLAKPFSVEEVVARIRAITRRGAEAVTVIRVGDLTLDLTRRQVTRAGRLIELSPREFRMIEALMQQAGTVCTRTMLLRQVWDYTFDPGTNLVDVYIRKLREKIDLGNEAPLLHTIRGKGYLMSEEAP